MKLGYKHTAIACYMSIAVQAIVNNLSPLLYVTFKEELGLSLVAISLLITANFAVQITVDLCGTLFIDRIGYKKSIIIANICVIIGLIFLGILPPLMESKFAAILIATIVSGIGGGLLEVVASPIIEAIPGDEKASAMSLLHSFYCWGQAAVILISTFYFLIFGIDNWRYLPIIWAILPALCAFLFIFVPVNNLKSESAGSAIKHLFTQKSFWLMMILMLAAGASELSISQWASMFAEKGLGISKTLGDILGPCAFAIFMGIARVLFGIYGERIKLEKCLTASFVLCVISYLIASLSQNPYISLAGCMLCGFSVAIMWPGTYSLGAKRLPGGGTLMFALFAFAGDMGCTFGPMIIGAISDTVINNGNILGGFIEGSPETVGMKTGILFAVIFPLVAIFASLILHLQKKKKDKSKSKDEIKTET